MDIDTSLSGSPLPLQVVSPERINQKQRETTEKRVPMSISDNNLVNSSNPNNSNNSSTMDFRASTASVVHEKVSQFNTLAMQSKQLERKTADAALKRAMLGREEAETEMRRYRDEARQLRKHVEEGRLREKRVSERLEMVMENYGRSKETHAHTQALWEKEIRRARKETFKSQSAVVKLQEELKSARAAAKTADEALEHERTRSKAREEEAFQARYALVGCREELEQAVQQVRALEQERDAFKSLAKSEDEIVRMASEGRLPLPLDDEEEEEEKKEEEQEEPEDKTADKTADKMDERADEEDEEDEEQQPLPKVLSSRRVSRRVSAALALVQSSAASEAEIDELTRLWQWEKQRADRASEQVEYLEAECHLRACSCMRKRPRTATPLANESPRKRRSVGAAGSSQEGDSEHKALAQEAGLTSPTAQIRANVLPLAQKTKDANRVAAEKEGQLDQLDQPGHEHSPKGSPPARASTRRSTIFLPEEGIFRTVSQEIAEEEELKVLEVEKKPEDDKEKTPMPFDIQPAELPMETDDGASEADVTADVTAIHHEQHEQHEQHGLEEQNRQADGEENGLSSGYVTASEHEEPIMYARTPSVDPPSFALLAQQQRTSLLSLLDAPHRQDAEPPMNFYVPTTSAACAPFAPSAPSVPSVPSVPSASLSPADGQEDSFVQANSQYRQNEDEGQHQHQSQSQQLSALSSSHHHLHYNQPSVLAAVPLLPPPLPQREYSHAGSDMGEADMSRVSDVTAGTDMTDVTAMAPSRMSVRQVVDEEDAMEVEGPREAVDVEGGQQDSLAASYAVATTVTRVPLREETSERNLAQRLLAAQRTPSRGHVRGGQGNSSRGSNESNMSYASHTSHTSHISHATSNPGSHDDSATATTPTSQVLRPALTALTPTTMTREQCLAQIRERRGRARSAQGHHPTEPSQAPSQPMQPKPAKKVTRGGSSGSGCGKAVSVSASGRPATTPRRPITPGKERRGVSAPVPRVASVRRR